MKYMKLVRVCKNCEHPIGQHRSEGGCKEPECPCPWKWDARYGVKP